MHIPNLLCSEKSPTFVFLEVLTDLSEKFGRYGNEKSKGLKIICLFVKYSFLAAM